MTNSRKEPFGTVGTAGITDNPGGLVPDPSSLVVDKKTSNVDPNEIKKLKELKPFWGNFVLWDYNGKRIRDSYAIKGAFLILLTSLLILTLPFIGAVPKTVTVDNKVHLNGRQTLDTLDSIYYNSQMLSANDTADFNIQTTNDMTLAVFNKSLDQLANANKRITGIFSSSYTITENVTEKIPVFLFKGDSLNIQLNINNIGQSSNPIFTIYSQTNNSYGITKYQYSHSPNLGSNYFSFTAPASDIWYLSLASNYGAFSCDIQLHYNISSIDLTSNLFTLNNNNSIQNSFKVPQNGVYYFILYYNQSNVNNEAKISYSFTFHLLSEGLNPIIIQLILIGFLMMIIITASFIQKISYKIKSKTVNQSEKSKEQIVNPENETVHLFCNNCGTRNSKSDMFCSKCGAKLKSGKIQIRKDVNVHSTKCSKCGQFLDETYNFCDTCGTKKV